jgi:hypothetical protein
MTLSPPKGCPIVKALIRNVPSELFDELYADAKRRQLQEKELQRLQEEKKIKYQLQQILLRIQQEQQRQREKQEQGHQQNQEQQRQLEEQEQREGGEENINPQVVKRRGLRKRRLCS